VRVASSSPHSHTHGIRGLRLDRGIELRAEFAKVRAELAVPMVRERSGESSRSHEVVYCAGESRHRAREGRVRDRH